MEFQNIDWRERWKEGSRQIFDSSEGKKAFSNVFDFKTGEALLKLRHRGVIEKLGGPLDSGKESKVFLAQDQGGNDLLVKIYMTRAGEFRDMQNYLKGDRRFSSVPSSRREVVEEWCRKEYSNLKKASDQVSCPGPLGFEKNVLVMEFVGKNGRAYPKLKEVEIENPEEALEMVIDGIKRLWREGEMVHGDLSEYNILVREDELVWIDFSQGVHRSHPEAKNLLQRDVRNISNFFQRQGAGISPEEKVQKISKELD